MTDFKTAKKSKMKLTDTEKFQYLRGSIMNYCKPEQAGISSKNVLNFYKKLERYNLSTHSVIMARGNDIFSETYYAPFHKDYLHRMYSVSKSFVSLAIGFCEQDGLLSLNDKMIKFFPEYINENCEEKILSATIEDMLKMQSAYPMVNWFTSGTNDRTEVYFSQKGSKNPGALFHYDSAGSYMLGVIVEKLTGKPFIEYLKDKCLREIGFSENAYCLKAPGGYSWGDSGVMATTKDLLLACRFVLNKGSFNGKRYLNEEYINKATDVSQVCNSEFGFVNHATFGYGYQFWGSPLGCFSMYGMGCQIGLMDPKHDFIFAINSDNQGNPLRYNQIFDVLYNEIIVNLEDKPLEENENDFNELIEYTKQLKLFALKGDTASDLIEKIDGKTYICEENSCGFKWFKINFYNDYGTLNYENRQGVKELKFGLGHNEFSKFPETGYSDMVGTISEPNHKYDCAVSADFPNDHQLRLRVQIIDKYFGNLAMLFGFKDEDTVSLEMVKVAEAFLNEYNGIVNAKHKSIQV